MMRLIVFLAVGLVVCNVGKSQTCNLAVALAMTAAGGQVERMEVHTTSWHGGPPCPAEVIAGNSVHFSVELSDVAVGLPGNVECSLKAELLDAGGALLELCSEEHVKDALAFGGNVVVATLDWEVPAKLPPGAYQFRFTARDSKEIEIARRLVRVRINPPDTFGVGDIAVSYDPDGKYPASGAFATGTRIYLVIRWVGLDTAHGRAWGEANATILDDADKIVSPTPVHRLLDEPLQDEYKRNRINHNLKFTYDVTTERPGKFRIRVELKDNVAKKSVVHDIPILVVASP